MAQHSHAPAHPFASPAYASPPVTLSDKLLSSTIPLPPNSRVAYVTLLPAADGPPYELLELGRRQLLSRNGSLTLFESILPHVHIDDTSLLHAFAFTSVDQSDACLATLKALSVEGLSGECSFYPSQLGLVSPFTCASCVP